jgi:uncharacterized protein YcfL
MKRPFLVVAFLALVLSVSCSSNGKELVSEPEMIMVADSVQEAIPTTIISVEEDAEVLSRFDKYMTQAKVHYVDALIAEQEEDSLELKFQLSIVFDLLANIPIFSSSFFISYKKTISQDF